MPTEFSRLMGPASAEFAPIADRLLGPREDAFVRAARAQSLRPEGGVSGQSLGSSGMLRGSDLARRGQAQGEVVARTAGLAGSLRGQALDERAGAEATFTAQHDDARRAMMSAAGGLGWKITEAGRMAGSAIGGGIYKQVRGDALAGNSPLDKKDAAFKKEYNDLLRRGFSRDAAYEMTTEGLGYEPSDPKGWR
jgi:hypothetical protein